MRGVWLEEGKIRVRDDLETPRPSAGEALVAVTMAGICGTDLALLRGYAGFEGVPGHEFCGRVVQCPERPGWIGRRVVAEINLSCGRCARCRAGLRNHCQRRSVVGIRGRPGAFAELLALPLANLHPVPDAVPDRRAVFTEPLAAALRIGEQVGLPRAEPVLLVGAGRLGQLIARALAASPAELHVVARHPRQRELLEGFAAAILAEDAVPAGRYAVAIEATGGQTGFEQAVRAVRPQGTVVLKSTGCGTAQLDPSRLVVDELTLVGSRCGPFEPALRLLEQGLAAEDLIDEVFPLGDAVEAFRRAARPGGRKVLLQPQG